MFANWSLSELRERVVLRQLYLRGPQNVAQWFCLLLAVFPSPLMELLTWRVQSPFSLFRHERLQPQQTLPQVCNLFSLSLDLSLLGLDHILLLHGYRVLLLQFV